MSRADHHGSPFQSIIPSAPAEPNDTCDKNSVWFFFCFKTQNSQLKNTLSSGQILWVCQVDAVESSSARFPPPSALEHGSAVEAGSVVVPLKSDLHSVLSLLRFTTDEHKKAR